MEEFLLNTLLLLEDDFSLVDGLVYSLKKNDFSVEVARTVQEALALLPELDRFDLLILDVTLPDGTGFDVCEAVRRQNETIPILFLTASDEEVNVIHGLDCGGDDYITKPFKLGELCSRIRALLRRSGLQKQPRSDILRSGPVSIDLVSSRVMLNGSPLDGAHSTSGVPVTMARSVWVSPSLTPLSVPVTLTDSPGLSTRVSQLSG